MNETDKLEIPAGYELAQVPTTILLVGNFSIIQGEIHSKTARESTMKHYPLAHLWLNSIDGILELDGKKKNV